MKSEEATEGALAAFSGIGAWLIPAWGCPVCLSAFAGTMSALGLGSLATEAVLAPLTVILLGVSLLALGFGARRTQRYGPILLGAVSAALLVGGKSWAEPTWLGYFAVAALLAASVWNVRVAASRRSSAVTPSDAAGFGEVTEGVEHGYETNRRGL
jgi:hypothetical protein